jgi:hypothetical protein
VVGAPDARRAWSDLIYSVGTGEPAFPHVFGTDTFTHRESRPADAAIFNSAMAELTRQVAGAVIAAYDFADVRTVMDIGGGNGAFLCALLNGVPHLNGILFDLPSGLTEATALIAGLGERCRIVPGDFFKSIPGKSDAYVMKSVIHDWDDERSRAILTNCAAAMPPHAKLLLIEQVLPALAADAADHRRVLLTDLNMLVMTGGRERDEAEYRHLLNESGLSLIRVLGTASSFSIIEAALR